MNRNGSVVMLNYINALHTTDRQFNMISITTETIDLSKIYLRIESNEIVSENSKLMILIKDKSS